MASHNKRIKATLALVLLLAFQPVVNAFSICEHAEQSRHAGHALHNMNNEHAMHQNDEVMDEQSSLCQLVCECDGACPHTCHITSLPALNYLFSLDNFEFTYQLIHSISFPGFTFHLLRPPANII